MKNLLLRSVACMLLTVVFYSAHAQTTIAIKPQDKGWNIDLLVAKWKTGNLIYDLNKDGNAVVTISGRECPATWAVKGSKVTITPKRLKWRNGDPCTEQRTLNLVSVSAGEMIIENPIITEPLSDDVIHLVKMK